MLGPTIMVSPDRRKMARALGRALTRPHDGLKTNSVVIATAGCSDRYTGQNFANNPCTRCAVTRCSAGARRLIRT